MVETLAPRSQSATISLIPIFILIVGSNISSSLAGNFQLAYYSLVQARVPLKQLDL